MTPKQILDAYAGIVRLRPGLSRERIAVFEAGLPGPLPSDIKELLAYTEGFELTSARMPISMVGGSTHVLFTGREDLSFPELIPFPVVLLGDGAGNFWAVDVNPNGTWGVVLFICHDPAVVVIQATDTATFLGQMLDPNDESNSLEYVMRTATMRIWAEDPWLIPVRDARMVDDPVISRFAMQLSEAFDVIDLRSKEFGKGFAWGKGGPKASILRNGGELLFAVERKRASFLTHMFSSRRSG